MTATRQRASPSISWPAKEQDIASLPLESQDALFSFEAVNSFESDRTVTLDNPSKDKLLVPPILPSQPLKTVGHLGSPRTPIPASRNNTATHSTKSKFSLASRRAASTPLFIDLTSCYAHNQRAALAIADPSSTSADSYFSTYHNMSDSQKTPLAPPRQSAPLAVPSHQSGPATNGANSYDSMLSSSASSTGSSSSLSKSALFSGVGRSSGQGYDAGSSSYDGIAEGSSGLNDQSALMQVLQGITEMRKELSRVHQRLDAIENSGDSYYNSSPNIMPRSLGRANSFRGLGVETPRSHSPDKSSVGLPPHIANLALAGAVAQPAPILTKQPDLGLWCVVPAGGAGTRLWPLSRESYPKFLLDLNGSGRTLIQSTWDRLLPLAGPSQLMVVTGAAHVDPVMGQLPDLDESNVFAEPSPKESMAAIGLAAAVLTRRDPEAVLGSFAADHIISGRDAFEAAVTEAVAVAKAGYLVTIGIAPSYPSTGFGYIKLGESLKVNNAPNARKVTEFKEKPDARTASAYLSTGNYRWNGGMFVVKAAVLMELLAKSMPALHDGLDKIASSWDTPNRQSVLNEVWPTLDKIAIDHAVAEPAARSGKVAVVPATFGWDDVGDFSSLADLLPAEKGEARVLGDSRMVITEGQAGGLIVPAGGRPIACLGVDDVVVVDTQQVLLVTTRARAQDVKKMVARVKSKNWTHLT
ncbi:unnamed protein product [Sympodiomycopsis kandeliae]